MTEGRGSVPQQLRDHDFEWRIEAWKLRKRRNRPLALEFSGGRETWWHPLRDAPALYREVAALNVEDPQAVVAWVNKRGMLWDCDKQLPEVWNLTSVEIDFLPFPLPFEETRDGCVVVELAAVQNELRALGDAVRTLDALRGKGPMPPTEYSPKREPGGEPVSFAVGNLGATGEMLAWAWRSAQGVRGRELYASAWAAFWQTLAWKLNRGLNVTITWHTNKDRDILVRRGRMRGVLIVPDFKLHFFPASLASCMWWQLYLDAIGDREYRQCPACGTWFLPGRADQMTCGRRCYMRKFMRHKRAWEKTKARVATKAGSRSRQRG
ncbi:MAG: hypothetical protein QN178_08520 [Armatimonadota bacterium]|nr:hypothetical protein [Armatimonadota bacterium]